jgi:hypothetical protein
MIKFEDIPVEYRSEMTDRLRYGIRKGYFEVPSGYDEEEFIRNSIVYAFEQEKEKPKETSLLPDASQL